MNSVAKHTTDLSPLQRRRLAWCVAEGWSPEKASLAAGLAVSEVERLLDDADFVHLVEGFQRLGEQSKDDILDQLTEMAWLVLEEALLEGDPRVALFFLKEEFAGYRPAEVIANAVLGPRGDGTTKKPMTVFVPPRWHERPVLRPKKAGGAGSQRWCPLARKLSTMQVDASGNSRFESMARRRASENRSELDRFMRIAGRRSTKPSAEDGVSAGVQVVYLRYRTHNQRLGFGSPLPGGGAVENAKKTANLHHGRQPHAP